MQVDVDYVFINDCGFKSGGAPFNKLHVVTKQRNRNDKGLVEESNL